jgi:zinc transporter ZupT
VGWLIAALAAPVAGPLLYRALHPHPRAVHLVDGGVYLAVPVLVAFQVLPHAWEDRSLLALVALGAGFALPALIERVSHAFEERTDNVALVVGLSGLVLHAVLEGGAFAPTADGPEAPFALAVTLHRIPVGLVIWWLIRPRFGIGWAATGVGSMVFGTVVGYVLGVELLGGIQESAAHLYQAFVSGSLVHVVYHQGRHDHDHAGDHRHHATPSSEHT